MGFNPINIWKISWEYNLYMVYIYIYIYVCVCVCVMFIHQQIYGEYNGIW